MTHGNDLKKFLWMGLGLLLSLFNTLTLAQSYEFRQGYIFEQSYVQKISLSQARERLGATAKVESLLLSHLSFDWTRGKERITDHRVKRSGPKLIFLFDDKRRLSLKDFSSPRGDEDSQRFKYLSALSGYHVVGVEYAHDQPQLLLIPEYGGRLYFVGTDQ